MVNELAILPIQANIYISNENDIKELLSIVKNTKMNLSTMLAVLCLMKRGEIPALERKNIFKKYVHLLDYVADTPSGVDG